MPPTSAPPLGSSVISASRRGQLGQLRSAAASRAVAGSSATWSRSRSSWARSCLIRAAEASAPGTSESLVRSWPASASESRQASGSETASPPGRSLAPSSRPQISVEIRSRSFSSTRPPSQVAKISW